MARLPSFRRPTVWGDARANKLIPRPAPVVNAAFEHGTPRADSCNAEVLAEHIPPTLTVSFENVASTAMEDLDISLAMVTAERWRFPPQMVHSRTALKTKTRFMFSGQAIT
jgi:hypothetical protein